MRNDITAAGGQLYNERGERQGELHILFTADRNYAKRIPVVLKSVAASDPGTFCHVHLIHDPIPEEEERTLRDHCGFLGYAYSGYEVPEELFSDAPVNKYYSKAMYYRMLAGEILPETVTRVLYTDPDILVINSLRPLWETELNGAAFAAATHNTEEGIADNLNRVRLKTDSVYYNTGVVLMDLSRCRELVKKEDIFSYIREHEGQLLLPDQDVFNALYWKDVVTVPDVIWNYDTRKYSYYFLQSGGRADEDWVMRNTAILHFCGKTKPWTPGSHGRFSNLYRHYANLCEREAGGRF